MTPNMITEAHSHSVGSRMTVAQRKEAHELRKVRMILGSFEQPWRLNHFNGCACGIYKLTLTLTDLCLFPDSQAIDGKKKAGSH